MHASFNDGFWQAGQQGRSRREFLKATGVSLGGVALASVPWIPNTGKSAGKAAIFIHLKGGPSQVDMYDMKPDAPAEIRGEFRPINTNVPGMRVCEHLPLHAKIANKIAIVHGVESIDSHRAPIFTAAAMDRIRWEVPALPHGDWDTHGRVLGRQYSIFEELRAKLPEYDRLIYELVTSIYDRGLQNEVLVVACGEFGRTPWINEHGGRNHWATSGSVLLAGGGLKTGQMIGNTGPIGEREQVRSKPYTSQNVLAMIYRHLGIDPATFLDNSDPIEELI